MTKAFDTKVLLERVKGRGLDVAEEGLKIATEEVLKWIEESVFLTENKWDDFSIPVIASLRPYVMAKIDTVDGEVG